MVAPTRVAVVGVLFGVVFGMGACYDGVDHRYWSSPDADRLPEEYDRHLGERALLLGTVAAVVPDDRRASIEVESSSGDYAMTVERFDAAVRPGEFVQAYGRLGRPMPAGGEHPRVDARPVRPGERPVDVDRQRGRRCHVVADPSDGTVKTLFARRRDLRRLEGGREIPSEVKD